MGGTADSSAGAGRALADGAGRARARAERGLAGSDGDLSLLLAERLGRLVSEPGCRRAAAWSLTPGGGVRVAAVAPPDAEADDAPPLRDLAPLFERPLDLTEAAAAGGGAGHAASRVLAAGFHASEPLCDDDGAPLALLVLEGDGDWDGDDGIRPRARAALAACADALAGPFRSGARAEASARREADRERVDRLASLGTIVADVAHEVRNPLVAVKTFLQLLPERVGDREFMEEYRSMVADEVARMERLLDGMIDHARPGSIAEDARSGASAAEVVGLVVELLGHRARERGVALRVELAADAPRLAIAPDRLQQVALNLLLNAIDASPRGAAVTIAPAEAGPGEAAGFRVDDEGPGIPPALRERVFEPFFTAGRTGGGGLGLAISRDIAVRCDGSLVAGVAPGGGARFEVRLPLC